MKKFLAPLLVLLVLLSGCKSALPANEAATLFVDQMIYHKKTEMFTKNFVNGADLSTTFQQITKDHSLLQEQIDAGMLTPEQALFSANKNLVTRALGVEDLALLETHQHEIQSGDVYLMCSDGLSDMLRDQQMADIIAAHTSLPDMGGALVAAANEAGGRDNIAVVLVRAQGAAEPASRSWWPFKRMGGLG